MRKYYAIIFRLFLCTFVALTQIEANEPDRASTQKQNPIVAFISTLDPSNVHLRSIVQEYIYSDETDNTIDPSLVDEDFLEAIARVDSRLFTLSKNAVFDSLLHDVLVAAERNVSNMDAKRVAEVADNVLSYSEDVLILEKAVALYAAAISQLNDENVAHAFARSTIFMLRRIIFHSADYTPTWLVDQTVPYVMEVLNKKMVADASFMSAILSIFDKVNVPSAHKALQKLFSKIVSVGVS